MIETRGRPTMVYPTTADPLQGYQLGGPVENRGIEVGEDRIVRSPEQDSILQQNFGNRLGTPTGGILSGVSNRRDPLPTHHLPLYNR